MFESRTVEVTEAGRVEVIRSPANGLTAIVEVNSTSVTTNVEPDGHVGVTVARGGTTIWQYELGAPRSAPEPEGVDRNAIARREAEEVLVPPAGVKRRGRPPSNLPKPERKGNTLADIAARQGKL